VILSLLVDHSLFVHPDQQDQLKNNLPAYTVGSLRANVGYPLKAGQLGVGQVR